jgi:predicted TIM-barrel fold metal-dependent hydrolase
MSIAGYRVLDADGHIYLTESGLLPYFAKEYYGEPVELEGVSGLFPRNAAWSFVIHAKNKIKVPKGRKAPNESPDAEGWGKFLDDSGIDAAVIYPSRLFHIGLIRDVEYSAAVARAYNNYLYDNFTSKDERLFGAAVLPLANGQIAAQELRRAVNELGMVTGTIMISGIQWPLGDEVWYPLYREAEKLDVILTVHSSVDATLGFDQRYFRNFAEVHTLSHGFSLMVQVVSAVLNGVFDVFPKLRMAFLEGGSNWTPFVMEKMDDEYPKNLRRGACRKLEMMPSEYCRSGRLFWHGELDRPSLRTTIQNIRPDVFFYASDFPHTNSQKVIEEVHEFVERKDFDDETKRSLLCGVADKMYGLERALAVRREKPRKDVA